MTDFSSLLRADRGDAAHAIDIVAADGLDAWRTRQPAAVRGAVAAQRFGAKPGTHAILPGDGKAGVDEAGAGGAGGDQAGPGDAWRVVAAVEPGPWALARLAEALPPGTYRLSGGATADPLGWLLGQYRFDRYRPVEDAGARVLLCADAAPIDEAVRVAAAVGMVRDLVNTPASDCGPAELEAAAAALARRSGATLTVTGGDALATGYPMIHIVGQAAARERAPRLIELEWGDPAHPRVALVGKGVCFDTGGLDLKPSAGMRLMKKDMGGAAHVLALAGLVIDAQLPVRLHVLVPAVENAVSGNAFRPGDVLRTRCGLTVENTNTDAEGRLILGDALTRAVEGAPALILDYATLTGAARVALGPDLPPLFCNDEALAADLLAAAAATDDPVWRMPLWDGYDEMLKSDVADIVNAPDGGFAGAVTAALFLRRFVPTAVPWAHLDVFAWRPAARPGRPRGGDAFALRAAWAMLQRRFGG